jgi:benzoate-CoA ligase
VVANGARGELPGHPTLDELLADAAPEFPSVPRHPDDPAFWLYTSGSTGPPKAAVHRQRDMVAVTETYLRNVLRLRPEDLGFSAPKLFFAYGLGNSLYFPLASGSRAVIQPGPATAEACFATLARHRPTVFYAVPTLYHAMVSLYEDWLAGRAEAPAPLPRLEHLRLALSGGEPLPAGVLARWREHFPLPILDGIGSTEALHFYLSNTPERLRPGSTGLPVPGYEVRLVDEAARETPSGAPGELWVRGASVAARYWNKPARTRAAFRGGWLATGDRFRRDAEGFYWYEGRMDDLLKVGGSWVNPLEVERVLLEHPAVAECAVVERPDPAGLSKARACVVVAPGHLPDAAGGVPTAAAVAALEADLRRYLAGRLAAFKVPRWIDFLPALPRTATGKLRRFLLRRATAQGNGQGTPAARQQGSPRAAPAGRPRRDEPRPSPRR